MISYIQYIISKQLINMNSENYKLPNFAIDHVKMTNENLQNTKDCKLLCIRKLFNKNQEKICKNESLKDSDNLKNSVNSEQENSKNSNQENSQNSNQENPQNSKHKIFNYNLNRNFHYRKNYKKYETKTNNNNVSNIDDIRIVDGVNSKRKNMDDILNMGDFKLLTRSNSTICNNNVDLKTKQIEQNKQTESSDDIITEDDKFSGIICKDNSLQKQICFYKSLKNSQNSEQTTLNKKIDICKLLTIDTLSINDEHNKLQHNDSQNKLQNEQQQTKQKYTELNFTDLGKQHLISFNFIQFKQIYDRYVGVGIEMKNQELYELNKFHMFYTKLYEPMYKTYCKETNNTDLYIDFSDSSRNLLNFPNEPIFYHYNKSAINKILPNTIVYQDLFKFYMTAFICGYSQFAIDLVYLHMNVINDLLETKKIINDLTILITCLFVGKINNNKNSYETHDINNSFTKISTLNDLCILKKYIALLETGEYNKNNATHLLKNICY